MTEMKLKIIWHSPEEKLPEDMKEVLLTDGKHVWAGFYHDGSKNHRKRAGFYEEQYRGDMLCSAKPDEIEFWAEMPTIGSSDNIIEFNGETKLDLPPDRVLGAAIDELDSVVILGYDKNGEFYAATSIGSDLKEVLWLLEQGKRNIL